MKPLQVSKDIIPLARFKTQASQIFRQLHEQQRPVVVTQNGQPAAVLITPDEFDRLQDHDRFLTAVQAGLADSHAGRLLDDESLETEIDAELGP